MRSIWPANSSLRSLQTQEAGTSLGGVAQFDDYGFSLKYSLPEIIDYRDVEYTPDEQLLMASEQFRLPRFQFLVRPALGEGNFTPHSPHQY